MSDRVNEEERGGSLCKRERGKRKSFDVFSSAERASGRMVDPTLAPLLEGADWFIKRSHRPHASKQDGINAGITLYLIHYRGRWLI